VRDELLGHAHPPAINDKAILFWILILAHTTSLFLRSL